MADLQTTSIHLLEVDEIERCKAIRLACLAEAPYAFGSTFEAESAQDEAWWRQRLIDGQWFVAGRGGHDLAVAMLTKQKLPESFQPHSGATELDTTAEYYWIRAVWVRPENRGEGLVDLLLNHLSHAATEAGAQQIILGVRDANERAIAAYRRIGFEQVGRFWPTNASVPQPNLLMARQLDLHTA